MADDFPTPVGSPVEFVGPFEHHEVVVNGWTVPYLTATPIPGGNVALTLDNRMGIDLSLEEVERVVPFLADAIAVASGYTAHPFSDDPPPERRPFTRLRELSF